MDDESLLSTTQDVSAEKPQLQVKEMTEEDLPPLLPQQRLMLHYIISGDNYTDAYRKAGYKSKDYTKEAAWILVTRDPLKSYLYYFNKQLAKMITPEYIQNRLNQITMDSVNKNDGKFYDPDVAVKAIAELNKMQGNYAQANVIINNINATVEDIRNVKLEYKKDK